MEADWGQMKRERGDGEISTGSIQDLASALLYFSQTDTSKRDTVAELERSTKMRDGEEWSVY
jgi:hypothetical protein